jgi:predicted dehydrogenase
MASKKKINVGIIGQGRAGWGMICNELDGHKREYTIAAACDLLPDRRKRFL